MKITDIVSFTKLSPNKDIQGFENGNGCIFFKDNAIAAYIHNGRPMKRISFVEFYPNTPRGGHFHKRQSEYICIVSGHVVATYWLADNPKEYLKIELGQGDIVHIGKGTAHIYESKQGAFAVEFSPFKFKQNDTYVSVR